MRVFPHNLPRATYWRFLLLRCRTAGSLNHLPGRVVQCRGTYVPASEQQIIYGSVDFPIPSIGLHLVPKMYHSGLCAKGQPGRLVRSWRENISIFPLCGYTTATSSNIFSISVLDSFESLKSLHSTINIWSLLKDIRIMGWNKSYFGIYFSQSQ